MKQFLNYWMRSCNDVSCHQLAGSFGSCHAGIHRSLHRTNFSSNHDGDIPAANFFLGVYSMQGMGADPDPAKAAKYFLKAAQAGHVQAQFNLGCCYLDGNGAPKDPQMAFFWFKKAADSGDPAALRQIGFCYLDGVGVAPDAEEGAAYLGQAAKRGDLEAKVELGRLSAAAKRNP